MKKNQLAKSGDPLLAANGELIEAEDDDGHFDTDHLPPPMTAVPFKAYRPISRRVLSELRTSDQALNVSLVVLGYTLLGLSDAELCQATKLTSEDIAKVRDSRAYADSFELIMRELINAQSEYIECRIAAYGGMALNNIAAIAATAKNKATRLAASRDLLDRGGHRPQDQASRQNSGMNELHIVITTPKDTVETQIAFKRGNEDANGSE